jgi:hypothetical protein
MAAFPKSPVRLWALAHTNPVAVVIAITANIFVFIENYLLSSVPAIYELFTNGCKQILGGAVLHSNNDFEVQTSLRRVRANLHRMK